DSIQTLHTAALTSAPGSVGQVRESAALLTNHCKAPGTACILIGHVTKEGAFAGPRVLEHLVDTVLYFEGDGAHALRVLRAAKNRVGSPNEGGVFARGGGGAPARRVLLAVKNRFGSTNEVGVFEMGEGGLAEVQNPSAAFLAERPPGAAGSAVLSTLEGSRPVLVEIQALVSRSGLAMPRRTAIGVDPGRLALLPRGPGGGRADAAAALAVVAAVASSVRGRALPDDVVLWGEVGLTGEVRSVARAES